MNSTKLNQAIGEMEDAAQELIGKAEACLIDTASWDRVGHRTALLEAAREYAAKLRKVARLA